MMKYAERDEHSACGISARVYFDGRADHAMIEEGLTALDCADSRGGMGLDGTGDGAGIQFDLPTALLNHELGLNLQDGEYGIGHIFLSQHEEHCARGMALINTELEHAGFHVIAWRQTPINAESLSVRAAKVMPSIQQVIFAPDSKDIHRGEMERSILALHQQIVNMAAEMMIPLDIASFSGDHIIYKGMLRASQVRSFFPDLSDPVTVSKKFMTHVRFSTNTGSNWANAQPFGLCANGEFNTIGSNIEDRYAYAHAVWGETPRMVSGWSDTRLFERDVAELRQKENLTMDEAIRRLMPPVIPASSQDYTPPVKAMVMWFQQLRRSYDGPSHVVFDGDGRFGAVRDGSGLRPSCAVLFRNPEGRKVFYIGSEDRIGERDGEIIERFSPSRGEMVYVQFEDGKEAVLKRDRQILDELASKRDYEAVIAAHSEVFSGALCHEDFPQQTLPLVERQKRSFWDMDALTKMLAIADSGKQVVLAMGDDSTPPMLSGRPHRIADFFKQRFVQVTAPAQDFIREETSASMIAWLGRHPAVGEIDKQIMLDSPVLKAGQLDAIEAHAADKIVRLDMTFSHAKGQLREALARLCIEAENAIHAGATILILSDKKIEKAFSPVPDALAVAAIDQHLKRLALRLHASIVVESGQVMNSHHAAVLLAFGATAVSPHLVYEHIQQQLMTHPSSYKNTSFAEQCAHFQKGMHDSIKVTMAKVGFPRASAYIGGGGAVMEAVGLKLDKAQDKADVLLSLATIFPTVSSSFGLYDLDVIEAMALMVAEHNGAQLPEHGVYMFKGTGKDRHSFSPRFVEFFREWQSAEAVEEVKLGGSRSGLTEPERRLMHTLQQPGQEAAYTAKIFAQQVLATMKGAGSEVSALEKIALGQTDDAAYDIVSKWLEMKYRQHAPMRLGQVLVNGRYDKAFIDGFTPSAAYVKYEESVKREQQAFPVTIMDFLTAQHGAVTIPAGYVEYGRVQGAQRAPLPLEKVQPVSSILKTIYSGAMSYGSTSSIAHGDLAEAHNALGTGGTNAGEGGEPTYRYGTYRNGKNKQWATGRFGTGAEMLAAIPDDGYIQIKIAQGAKPGEGGELPAMKVSVEIASNRNSIPGVELISPAPHHDIYSIEDLKALIMAHKQAGKRVSVKLAATKGIGTIACGVAKAGADQINIASESGGTGASKETSVKNTGISGLLGLIEADHALKREGLRDKVGLITSGSFRTSEDLLKSAIWADGFELGTLSLMETGCVMIRECGKAPKFDKTGEELLEAGGCSVGVTNTPWLYSGKIEDVERFTLNLAAHLRARLAALGFASLDEIKGHTELLGIMLPDYIRAPQLGAMFNKVENTPIPYFPKKEEIRKNTPLLKEILQKLKVGDKHFSFFAQGIVLDSAHHTFGVTLSVNLCNILRRFPEERRGYVDRHTHLQLTKEQYAVKENAIHIMTSGNGGQTYGFVNAHGIHLDHTGRVHDFVGNSMTGGIISISAPEQYRSKAHMMQSAGNSCLYGASGGKVFIDGCVGDRFAVRNSGTTSVISGNAGDYACEYMTAGSAIFLGKVGKGFGAGMVSGIAVLYDDGGVADRLDKRFVEGGMALMHSPYAETTKLLIAEHASRTNSHKSASLLANWGEEQAHFTVVMPKALLEMQRDLESDHAGRKQDAARRIRDIIDTYNARETPICPFMNVWLAEQKKHLSQSIVTCFVTLEETQIAEESLSETAMKL